MLIFGWRGRCVRFSRGRHRGGKGSILGHGVEKTVRFLSCFLFVFVIFCSF